jgi:hypothetical protein
MNNIKIKKGNKIIFKSYFWANGDLVVDFKDLNGVDLSDMDLRQANLSGANLSYAKLQNANLWNTNLRGANLSYAHLMDARLDSADLRGARLDNADLLGARLDCADLSDTYLRHADLNLSNLSHANLSGANLDSVDLLGANLKEVNLRGARFMFDTETHIFNNKSYILADFKYITYIFLTDNFIKQGCQEYTIDEYLDTSENSKISQNLIRYNYDLDNNESCKILVEITRAVIRTLRSKK